MGHSDKRHEAKCTKKENQIVLNQFYLNLTGLVTVMTAFLFLAFRFSGHTWKSSLCFFSTGGSQWPFFFVLMFITIMGASYRISVHHWFSYCFWWGCDIVLITFPQQKKLVHQLWLSNQRWLSPWLDGHSSSPWVIIVSVALQGSRSCTSHLAEARKSFKKSESCKMRF